MSNAKLLLLPNVLDESLSHDPFFPLSVAEAVQKLDGLIAESEKSARRYLRRFISHEAMQSLPIKLLNEHTPEKEKAALLEPILSGETWGLITDAGLPCIADPGSDLVLAAHRLSITVEAFTGPCSPVLALQLSGFSGQKFTFHGYLPRESEELKRKLKELESKCKGETQIWIEAPYRSLKMFEMLKETLSPATLLCVAVHLTTPTQRVESRSIQQWKSRQFVLGKEPAVFLIYRS